MERGVDIEPSPSDEGHEGHDPIEDHDPYGIDDRLEDHLAVLEAARKEGMAPIPSSRRSSDGSSRRSPGGSTRGATSSSSGRGAASEDDGLEPDEPPRDPVIDALLDDPLDDADLEPSSLRLSSRASKAPITDRLTRSGGRLQRTSVPSVDVRSPDENSPPRRRLGSSPVGDLGPQPPGGLDVVPGGRGPEPPGISPRMTAVFGGLFGMATVASIIALLIQVFPVQDQQAAAEGVAPEPSDSAGEPTPAPRKDGPIKRERTLLPSPWRISALKDSHKLIRGTMNRQAFVTVLQDKGVEKGEVYRILKAFEGVREFDRTGPKDQFTVAIDRQSKKVEAFEYEVSGVEIYQARVNDQGLLVGSQLDMKVGFEEYAAAFRIGEDFTKSYTRRGLEKGLVKEINRAFNGRTSTEAFEPGGIIKVAVVEKTRLGAFYDYDHIKVIEYQPPGDGKPIRAYWFEGEDYKGYVDEKGRRPTNKGWRSPVPGAPVTSNFNPKRLHPILKVVRPHNGTDFGAPAGTPVYAAMRGKIAFQGRAGGYGNLIRIDHPGSIQTGYAHLQRFAKGIKQGDAVATRQLIGYVGSTGRSTGPHLHFEAKRNGKYFNALDLKLDALRLLPVGERAAFLAQKRSLDALLQDIEVPEPPPPEPEPAPEPEPQANEDDEGDADSMAEGDADEGDTDEGDADEGDADEGDADEGDTDGGDTSSGDTDGNDLMGDDLTDIE